LREGGRTMTALDLLLIRDCIGIGAAFILCIVWRLK
jgi:hypothetical protein